MSTTAKDPCIRGPFLIQGELKAGGEVQITCKEGDEYTMFSIRFFASDGREIASSMHRPPPRIAYVPIPSGAATMVLRSPQSRAAIQIK